MAAVLGYPRPKFARSSLTLALFVSVVLGVLCSAVPARADVPLEPDLDSVHIPERSLGWNRATNIMALSAVGLQLLMPRIFYSDPEVTVGWKARWHVSVLAPTMTLFAISMAFFALRRRRQEGWGKRVRRGSRRLALAGLACAAGLLALEFTLRHHLRWAPQAETVEPALPGDGAGMEFYELDRLKLWNRAFVAARPEQFAGWPIPLEQFDHDGPAPRYVFKVNQRMALRQGSLAPALTPGVIQQVRVRNRSTGVDRQQI